MRLRARHVPRPRRRRRGLAGVRGDRATDRVLRRRGRAISQLQPADRRGATRGWTSCTIYPAKHFVTSTPTIERAVDEHPARAGGAGAASSRRRASCSRPSGCASAPSTTSRCCGRSATAPASRTTPATSSGRTPRRAAVHAARLLPRRLPLLRRRVARRPCRRSAACSPATARASRRSSSTASGCPARSTTGRSSSTSSRARCQQVLFVSATPGPVRAERTRRRGRRAGDPADGPGRPGDRACARPRARWTTCSNEIRKRAAEGRARRWSRR